MLNGLLHPHTSIPYVQMSRSIYSNTEEQNKSVNVHRKRFVNAFILHLVTLLV